MIFVRKHCLQVQWLEPRSPAETLRDLYFLFVTGFLDFPPVDIIPKDSGVMVTFDNPFNFYPELRSALRSPKAQFTFLISSNHVSASSMSRYEPLNSRLRFSNTPALHPLWIQDSTTKSFWPSLTSRANLMARAWPAMKPANVEFILLPERTSVWRWRALCLIALELDRSNSRRLRTFASQWVSQQEVGRARFFFSWWTGKTNFMRLIFFNFNFPFSWAFPTTLIQKSVKLKTTWNESWCYILVLHCWALTSGLVGQLTPMERLRNPNACLPFYRAQHADVLGSIGSRSPHYRNGVGHHLRV